MAGYHLQTITRRPKRAQSGDETDPNVLFFLDAVIGFLQYVGSLKAT